MKMPGASAHNLVAVVPLDLAPKMQAGGWRSTGRQNGLTVTMYRRFSDADAAMIAGRKLRFVWAAEPA